MAKKQEVYVTVGAVSIEKKNVETAYQKSMPKVVEKAVSDALTKAKSKNILTKPSKSKDDTVYQLTPKLKCLKKVGEGSDIKIRAEVSVGYLGTKNGKIIDKLTTITSGANATPPKPLPKKLDADFQAAVEAAGKDAIGKVIKRIAPYRLAGSPIS